MAKTERPAPAGQGTYAELDGDNTFTGDNEFTGDNTFKGNVTLDYPNIPYNPTYVIPLRSDLLPTTGTSKIVFTRASEASWTDYDGILRWAPTNTPRFSSTRVESGSPKTTTTDGRLIPDDMSGLGTILIVGDSQGADSISFPEQLVLQLKGATIINDCVSGKKLVEIADDIIARLTTYSPNIVIIEGGFNDVINSETSADMLTAIEFIVSACIQYGAEPIMSEITPIGSYVGWSAAIQTKLEEYNAGLAVISDTYGYKLVKLYQIFGNPTAPTELNPLYGLPTDDGLHWGTVGGLLVTGEIINALDYTYLRGFLVERNTFNQALYSQDFSNAAWVKSNVAVVADSETAPDLTTTSDTITASAANGTLLQTYIKESANFCFSIWLKRKTGTGTVYLTIDGGTTLTAVNASDTWRRFFVTKEAADPSFGIKIVTDTDAVYAYGGQLETGTYPTSYFQTLAAIPGERKSDRASMSTTGIAAMETSKVATIDTLWPIDAMAGAVSAFALDIAADSGTAESFRFTGVALKVQKVTAAAAVQNLTFLDVGQVDTYLGIMPFITKSGYSASLSGQVMLGYDDGSFNVSKAITDFKTYGATMGIGGGASTSGIELNGHIKNLIIYNKVLSAEQMNDVTSW